MAHTNVSAAAAAAATTAAANTAATASRSNVPRPAIRPQRPSGSFHAGEPFPDVLSPYNQTLPSSSRRRRSSAAARLPPPRRESTNKYHTFPTEPPATPLDQREPFTKTTGRSWLSRYSKTLLGRQSHEEDGIEGGDREGSAATTNRGKRPDDNTERHHHHHHHHHDSHSGSSPSSTPLPWRQLGVLAVLSLAEQTALNSIGPYLPAMVSSFPEIPDGQEGLYVGLLASAFAMAQLTTNLLWGWLSDRIGRKPVMLLGTSLLTGCFCFFGFCTTYAQLIMVHIAMGLLNGNAAVVPTCLGEVTDKTNQSRAFTWLPVIYSLGSITGPALGGLLVGTLKHEKYPFLAPNLVVAAVLAASVVVLAIWFEETLEGNGGSVPGPALEWIKKTYHAILTWLGIKIKEAEEEGVTEALLGDNESVDSRGKTAKQKSAFRQLANRNTLAVLGTYLVFQLANISFNSLYPIFVSSPLPTGRDLGPEVIGLSLSLAGVATIFFQVSVFQSLKANVGNLGTYRYSLLGMAIAMTLMPWIGYLDSKPSFGIGSGKAWLYSELGVILIIKNICAVGGLSSVMLLITNSAPSHQTLGTLQGIAQTLSAAGRSVGPFLSGGLFTLSTRVKPKGEALAWGLFAGVTLGGWLWSWVIRGDGLESAEFEGDEGDVSGGEEEDEDENIGA
ncbi:major facilitator superfamily domain-containing protein [Podospora australis]|uniref:Major facilitator superfamily domain-containing protein n=1 Tax=Podospora australis TaxID=1536484 RepID=A0AAN6WLQ2_9PEZI|nr:major facilitator superfamily domain-containing protein [Podospora australis]